MFPELIARKSHGTYSFMTQRITWEERVLEVCFWKISSQLPCDRTFLHYSNHFLGVNFGIALHSLYRKYFSAEIILLYITLSWPQPLSCISFWFYTTLHFKNQKRINYVINFITVNFITVVCKNFRSTGTQNNVFGFLFMLISGLEGRPILSVFPERRSHYHLQGLQILWSQGKRELSIRQEAEGKGCLI